MIEYGVIGTPKGFESLTGGAKAGIALESIIDLKNSIVKVYPDTDILRIHREVGPKTNRIYYVYYRYATEIASSRPGGFYGSVVMLETQTAAPKVLLNALRDLAQVVKDECLDDESRFTRRVSDLKFSIPESVKTLGASLMGTDFPKGEEFRGDGFLSIGLHETFSSYEEVLRSYLADQILPEFKSLFLSTSATVAEYVKQKRGLPTLNYPSLLAQRQHEIQLQKEREERERLEREERERKERADAERREKERVDRENREAAERRKAEQDEQRRRDDERRRSHNKGPRNVTHDVSNAQLRQDIIELRSRVDELEGVVYRRKKAQNDHLDGRFRRWKESVSIFLRKLGWLNGLILLFILIVVAVLSLFIVRLFMSESPVPDSETQIDRSVSQTTTRSSPTPKPVIAETLQLNYSRTRSELKTIKELSEHVKQLCSVSCPALKSNDILQSLLNINGSIREKLGDRAIPTNEDAQKFNLKEVKGTITFEVPTCCDLHRTNPDEFVRNDK